MINIINIEYINNYNLKLNFSDNSYGVIDFTYLVNKNSSLTNQLKDINYFKHSFIDFGALCWKNGLELSAESLNLRLQKDNLLQYIDIAS